MPIRRKRGWELPERAATPEHVWLKRRHILQGLGLGGAILALPLAVRMGGPQTTPAPAVRRARGRAPLRLRPASRSLELRGRAGRATKPDAQPELGMTFDAGLALPYPWTEPGRQRWRRRSSASSRR